MSKFAKKAFPAIIGVFYLLSVSLMLDYTGAVAEYAKMSYEEQKVRLVTLFEIFKAYSVSIQDMLSFLSQDKMSQQDMMDAYSALASIIQKVDRSSLTVEMGCLEAIHDKLELLRQQEAAERVQEDPEALLRTL